MKINFPSDLLSAWHLSAVCIFSGLAGLQAQLPSPTPADLPYPPYATITYADGSSVVAPGASATFPLIGLQPNQVVQVTVQYPAAGPPVQQTVPLSLANALIVVQSLDGAAVLPPSGVTPVTNAVCLGCDPKTNVPLLTNAMAQLSFSFVAGPLPGSYRVALRHGTRAMLLEFWVIDPQNPEINPPAITPSDSTNY